jgi:hypothetical protein
MDTGDGISASRFSYLVHVSLAPCGWLLVRDRPIRPSSVQELRFDFLTSPSGVSVPSRASGRLVVVPRPQTDPTRPGPAHPPWRCTPSTSTARTEQSPRDKASPATRQQSLAHELVPAAATLRARATRSHSHPSRAAVLCCKAKGYRVQKPEAPPAPVAAPATRVAWHSRAGNVVPALRAGLESPLLEF